MKLHAAFVWTVLGLLAATACLGAAAPSLDRLPPAAQGKATGVVLALLADTETIAPGAQFRLGLLLRHEVGWHTYWKTPGTGQPVTIEWTSVPEGFTVGAPLFPAPHTVIEKEDEIEIVTHELGGDTLLLVPVAAPAEVVPGRAYRFEAAVKLLACKVQCIPGEATLVRELPGAAEPAAAGANRPFFDQAAALVPLQPGTPGLEDVETGVSPQPLVPGRPFCIRLAVFARPGSELAILPGTEQPLFIPYDVETFFIEEAGAEKTEIGGRPALLVSLRGEAAPETAVTEQAYGGLLQYERIDAGGVRTTVKREVAFAVPLAAAPALNTGPLFAAPCGPDQAALAPASAGPAGPSGPAEELVTASVGMVEAVPAGPACVPESFQVRDLGVKKANTLPLILLFGFIGGLLLNVMPCVLPVLSLKVFGLVRQAGDDRRTVRLNGIFYTLGILASFLVMAIVLILVKSGGQSAGWGFQFQEPGFVAALAAVIYVFALSMFGVFEFAAPAAVQHAADRTQAKEGPGASFANGVLATLLATPCTAPFLGSALAYALTQSGLVIVLFFLVIGFGLGLPFLLLAMVPRWTRIMPRPGAWMDSFKQAMAFLLVAAALWLVSVLSAQVTRAGLVSMLAYLALLSLASWIYGRWGALHRPRRTRLVSLVAALALVVLGAIYVLDLEPAAAETTAAAPASHEAAAAPAMTGGYPVWSRFSPALMEKLCWEKKTVFVDFTARWCLTCQMNKPVLHSAEVQQLFAERQIVSVLADFTNRDPEMKGWIERLGKGGVPVYAIFPGGDFGRPVVLNEFPLTRKMVEDGVAEALGR